MSTESNTGVRPGGEKFMGAEKQVNVGEISLALLYDHARTGRRASLEAVERMQHQYAEQTRLQRSHPPASLLGPKQADVYRAAEAHRSGSKAIRGPNTAAPHKVHQKPTA